MINILKYKSSYVKCNACGKLFDPENPELEFFEIDVSSEARNFNCTILCRNCLDTIRKESAIALGVDSMTQNLISELKKKEDVKATYIEKNGETQVHITGPAVILAVTD